MLSEIKIGIIRTILYFRWFEEPAEAGLPLLKWRGESTSVKEPKCENDCKYRMAHCEVMRFCNYICKCRFHSFSPLSSTVYIPPLVKVCCQEPR